VPQQVVQELRALRPSLEVAETNAPHFVLQVAGSEVARRVEEFVARVAPGSRPSREG
jgi:hypothetical protein